VSSLVPPPFESGRIGRKGEVPFHRCQNANIDVSRINAQADGDVSGWSLRMNVT
jgi:hypothetical protein